MMSYVIYRFCLVLGRAESIASLNDSDLMDIVDYIVVGFGLSVLPCIWKGKIDSGYF